MNRRKEESKKAGAKEQEGEEGGEQGRVKGWRREEKAVNVRAPDKRSLVVGMRWDA